MSMIGTHTGLGVPGTRHPCRSSCRTLVATLALLVESKIGNIIDRATKVFYRPSGIQIEDDSLGLIIYIYFFFFSENR